MLLPQPEGLGKTRSLFCKYSTDSLRPSPSPADTPSQPWLSTHQTRPFLLPSVPQAGLASLGVQGCWVGGARTGQDEMSSPVFQRKNMRVRLGLGRMLLALKDR